MIPLRPELAEFMDAESLGRYGSVSKTLRTDVRETNAWTLLAAVQCLTTKGAHERVPGTDMASIRHGDLLNAPPPPPELRNNFTDFTFFLRIEDRNFDLGR